MPMTIDMKEAEARFEELVAKAEAGEEIVICRDGAPVAQLAAFDAGARRAAIEKAIEDVRAFRAGGRNRSRRRSSSPGRTRDVDY